MDIISVCWYWCCSSSICIAIVAGGPALYAYRNEIIKMLVDQGYKCKECKKIEWNVIDEENTQNTNDYSNNAFISNINRLEKELENDNFNNFELILSTGSNINHLNIELVYGLLKLYNIKEDYYPTQSKKIKALEKHLEKNTFKSLYFINDLRNKILHPDDYKINLHSEEDQLLIKDECKIALKKMKSIYIKYLLQ